MREVNNKMARILVVDDDREIGKLVDKALSRDGHQVIVKESAEQITIEEIKRFDLLLLDVMMPQIDGFSFCKRIRQEVDCPILFLTAKTMEQDVVEGFSIGADDYIKKPFGIAELRARVMAHIRREQREHHQVLSLEEFRFDLEAKELYVAEEKLPLTKGEYAICEYLAKNRGQVFSLEQILEAAFGYESESEAASIRMHIKNIRGKITEFTKFTKSGACPIETVWGIGYKWK